VPAPLLILEIGKGYYCIALASASLSASSVENFSPTISFGAPMRDNWAKTITLANFGKGTSGEQLVVGHDEVEPQKDLLNLLAGVLLYGGEFKKLARVG
jgi:hypothetical protein